jgi:hypothetical protein
MIIIPWETALVIALIIFGFGFLLCAIPWLLTVVREPKDDPGAEPPAPANDADAMARALDLAEKAHEKYWQAFRAMSKEDRLSNRGAKVAYICDRVWKAHEHLEDASEVARGEKVVFLADPEAQACTVELIDEMETFDNCTFVAGPRSFDPEPTRH